MTRKDYVALAQALKDAAPMVLEGGARTLHHQQQWIFDRDSIANVLAADNPRFDRERFVKACEGVTR